MKLKPLTLNKAKQLKYGDTVYEKDKSNANGTPRRWKVTGKVKTWKRDNTRVKVPVKHGLYEHCYITEDNINHVLVEKGGV